MTTKSNAHDALDTLRTLHADALTANAAAQDSHKVALDDYHAAPSDKRWAAVEQAESTVKRRARELTEAKRRLTEGEAAAKAASADAARTADAARLADLGTQIEAQNILDPYAAKLLALESAIADTFAALDAEIAADAARRTEARTIAGRLGVDIVLPLEVTRTRVLALVSVAEHRAALSPPLPRAPKVSIDRERFLLEFLQQSAVVGDEVNRAWPIAARIASLVDGTYAAERARATAALKEEAAEQRAASAARVRELDRLQGERDRLRSRSM